MSNNQTTLAKWFHKNGYEPIAPMDFYRAIFPSGELATYPCLRGCVDRKILQFLSGNCVPNPL